MKKKRVYVAPCAEIILLDSELMQIQAATAIATTNREELYDKIIIAPSRPPSGSVWDPDEYEDNQNSKMDVWDEWD